MGFKTLIELAKSDVPVITSVVQDGGGLHAIVVHGMTTQKLFQGHFNGYGCETIKAGVSKLGDPGPILRNKIAIPVNIVIPYPAEK